ncbi:MAG: hypothetical protein J0G96_00375, partial [Flavobacteriia bacterium]|nr:hypothetical protein [Flavobacteriia bacterium]
MKTIKLFVNIITFSLLSLNVFSQMFPNPTTLSTGQGAVGTNDPVWTCSQWYSTQPTTTSGAT